MSHVEIWDDSALVDSWNEALDEYKHYHSIHAHREKIEDILRAHDDQKDSPDIVNARLDNQRSPADGMGISNCAAVDDNDEGKIKEGMEPFCIQTTDKLSSQDQASAATRERVTHEGPEEPPPLPQFIAGSVHDENLKKLLMSWYYAGYYTGLYEEMGRVCGPQVDEAMAAALMF